MKANDLDEVTFDYLEGNLLPEEKDAFEMLMAESEVISHEVRLWKNTYVDESLPEVAELERKLIRPESNSATAIVTRIVVLVILLWPIWSTVKYNTEGEERIPSTKETIPQDVVVKDDCTPTLGQRTSFGRATNAPDSVSLSVSASPNERSLAMQLNDLEFDVLIKGVRLDAAIHAPIVIKPEIQTQSKVKKLSRKELRAINKKKREDFDRQQQMKSMKGNVPYVVPLNSRNF